MNLKSKFFCSLILSLFLIAGNLFAQTFIDAEIAQRQTALRCANTARNYLLEENYGSALIQAEIGLSYDKQLSDLWYIKAVCASKNERSRYETLECAKNAYEYNDWNIFDPTQGLIIYADILIDTNNPEYAYQLLESKFSKEIEYLKAKACYFLGDIAKARSLLSSAYRVFSEEARFPYLFFRSEFFESVFIDKPVDDAAFELSKTFLTHIQDWESENPDILFYASFFTQNPDEQKRLFGQYIAQNHMICEAVYYAVKQNFITQDQAFLYFKEFADEIDYAIFVKTLTCFTEDLVVEKVKEYLASYDGTILLDSNRDFIHDFSISYLEGRPYIINADFDQNDLDDFVVNCEFGLPYSAFISKTNIEIQYDIYPVMKSIKATENTQFELVQNAYSWECLNFQAKVLFNDLIFYYVFPTEEKISQLTKVDFDELMQSSRYIYSRVQKDFDYYEKKFLVVDGLPQEIEYERNGSKYAKAFLENGNVSYRIIDNDFDGSFELTEYYEFDQEKCSLYASEEESQRLYSELFGTINAQKGLYLKKVALDSNADGLVDVVEEYFPDG
nr:hypothetical protein [Treponemataceae bacterium]